MASRNHSNFRDAATDFAPKQVIDTHIPWHTHRSPFQRPSRPRELNNINNCLIYNNEILIVVTIRYNKRLTNPLIEIYSLTYYVNVKPLLSIFYAY